MVEVGRLLANKNCIVTTGAFGGVMEAAAKGAMEAGGRTIGYTILGKASNTYIQTAIDCRGLLHPIACLENEQPNPTIQYAIRLGCLLSSDGFILTAGGGPGSMTELMAIINLSAKIWKKPKKVSILKLKEVPAVSWGNDMFDTLYKWGVFPAKVQKNFRVFMTPEEAVDWVTG